MNHSNIMRDAILATFMGLHGREAHWTAKNQVLVRLELSWVQPSWARGPLDRQKWRCRKMCDLHGATLMGARPTPSQRMALWEDASLIGATDTHFLTLRCCSVLAWLHRNDDVSHEVQYWVAPS